MTLDASAYLLLAEGHLRKGEEIVRQMVQSQEVCWAKDDMQEAVYYVRRALRRLAEEKEEPCNKP